MVRNNVKRRMKSKVEKNSSYNFKDNLNRKGNVTWILTVMIIGVLGFFVYLGFFANVAGGLVTDADDLACRMFLASKSYTAVQVGELFYKDLRQKCKKDDVKKTVDGKEEVFEVVGDSMKRCWYRYGESEYDFLSFWNKGGGWCFVCTKLDIEDEENPNAVYDYNEFVEWANSSKSEFSLRNGSKVNLLNYVQMKYAYVDDEEELRQTREDIDELLKDGEGYTQNSALLYDSQYNDMQNLRLKEIQTDENLYVVYRYDKRDITLLEEAEQAAYGALGGAVVGIGTAVAAEFVVDKVWGLSLCGASFFIPGAPLVVCSGMALKSVASFYKSAEKIEKISRIRTLIKRIDDFFSKTIVLTKTTKKAKLLEGFTGSVTELPNIIKKLEKIDPDLAKRLTDVEKIMKKLNIDKIDDLDIKDLEKYLDDMDQLVNGVLKFDLTDNADYINAVSDLNDMKKLEKEVIEIFGSSNVKEVLEDVSKFDKVKTYLRRGLYGASAVAGASIGASINLNSEQYVDVMTKEQYYRVCGTERMLVD